MRQKSSINLDVYVGNANEESTLVLAAILFKLGTIVDLLANLDYLDIHLQTQRPEILM